MQSSWVPFTSGDCPPDWVTTQALHQNIRTARSLQTQVAPCHAAELPWQGSCQLQLQHVHPPLQASTSSLPNNQHGRSLTPPPPAYDHKHYKAFLLQTKRILRCYATGQEYLMQKWVFLNKIHLRVILLFHHPKELFTLYSHVHEFVTSLSPTFIQNITRYSGNSCISQISLNNMARYLLAHDWKAWHIAVEYVTVPWHAEILASSTALGCRRLQLCCQNGWTQGGACKLTAKMNKRCTMPGRNKY